MASFTDYIIIMESAITIHDKGDQLTGAAMFVGREVPIPPLEKIFVRHLACFGEYQSTYYYYIDTCPAILMILGGRRKR